MKKTILVYLLLIACTLSSQNANYRFKNISTNDGLSQSSVIAIHQDKLGQMWFGTRNGLNKYDGSKFTVYRTDETNPASISNNDILSIKEDQFGKLWIGTYNGLNCYNPVNNTFKRYSHSNLNNSLSNNAIWCIKEIGDEIWIGTSEGITIYNQRTKKIITLFHARNNKNSLPSNYVLSIINSKKNGIWIGTSKGFCKLNSRKNNQFEFVRFGPENLFVQCMMEDAANTIWIGTKNKGLVQLHPNTKVITFLSNKPNFNKLNSDIRTLSIDNRGSLWIGAYDGIYVLENNTNLQQIKTNSSNQPNIDKIKSIYTDNKGSVWIGSYYNGINLWDVSNTNFTNFNQNSIHKKLSFNVVSSIVADKNKNIYLGTEGSGITVFDAQSQNSRFLNTPNNSQNDIKSLHISPNGTLWIGTFTKGFTAYNTKSKRFTPEIISQKLSQFVEQTGIYSIIHDDSTHLWLGSFGKGLIQYNTTNGNFHVIDNSKKTNFLTNNRIRTLLVDSKKTLWVGTQNGLNRIFFKNKEKTSYVIKHYFFDNNLLSGDDILTVFQDRKNQIWIGTKAKGLYFFDGKKFVKTKLLNLENTLITSIHTINEDANHNLWMSSNEGIIKYNPNSKKIVVYNQKDGLVGNEFNDNSCLQINDSQFYFGGPLGVSFLDTKTLSHNNYIPQVLITNLKIKNESINANDANGILEKSIGYTKSVTLAYDKANFSINYAIPNFIRPKNNQYKYRLTGLENNWTITKNTEATYIIQNPGTYTFEVYGANNDGIWNKKPTTLTFIIKPAPWRSIWAMLIYLLIIGFAVYKLNWILKSKANLKQKLELEYIEAERIKETNQAKLEFFTNISHEFRTPLTLILGPLQQILLKYNGTNDIYKKLLVIESSANHLLSLINRLMDFRKLETKQYTLEAAEGNVVKFTKEIYLSFIEYAKDGDYTYTFESSNDEILLYYDRPKLERVFYNLISNAFRYTPKGGIIAVKITTDDKNISIEVDDSGVGIAEQHIEKIFDLFFEIPLHNKVQENYNKGTGIGLSIVKNIVQLHKGTITVQNKETEGVIFKVSLPLGKEHLMEDEILTDFKISDDISQYTAQLEEELIVENNDISELIPSEDKKTILIVEDHVVLRNFMKNLLKDEYNIIQADNGKKGLKKAINDNPDLIISDVIMPEMVGTELCAKIKEDIRTSHIPVILLTSRSALVYKFEGLESGADDYISKPFNLIEFKLRIKNILESTERLKAKFANETSFSPSEITVSSLDEELLKKAFQIVEDNISNEHFDIPFFCSELGVGRSMLFSKIKAWTNFTPNEFIHEIRLKRAAQLLEQHKINISQVSYKVGFNNPKYFSKCFQKKFGETPSQYADKFSKEDA
ncbi:two-component regulator propeller domain-containing protein [Flavobacterium sp. NG2]|uniref:two-component regulator propeller domain-containing protein n=1 Tax=Flavobacterium sp. NG2 TaxID=3097547 RepID=UPI002A819F0F|nr:two-component regulator propeller domain-containing protein [Flavobacterium sp. NG2]WPR71160.1 two-component regulator propeller domain-containing protein [Flavobacterium sp. NG2]